MIINSSKFLLILLISKDTFAAACCGGVSPAPALISGDDRYQLNTSVSHSIVIGDVSENGDAVFRGSNSDEVTKTFRVDASAIFSDRTQASISLPFTEKSQRTRITNDSNNGLGDISLGLGYEAWPEWSYSAWPRGYLFTQLNLPLAHSIYDSTSPRATDAYGTGFYRVSVGALLLKAWGNWDTSAVPEIHHSFARTFTGNGNNQINVSPGLGSSVSLGLGYNFATLPIRLGLRVQPTWSQEKEVKSEGLLTTSSRQWVWNTGVDLSYLISTEWTVTSSYTDQTILGPAANATLSRTFALNLQRRWPR